MRKAHEINKVISRRIGVTSDEAGRSPAKTAITGAWHCADRALAAGACRRAAGALAAGACRCAAALIISVLILVAATPAAHSYAAETPIDHQAYLVDSADLLTGDEEQELMAVMDTGTEYGEMVFVTMNDAEGYDSSDYVERLYQTSSELSGRDAVIYVIDMDNRMLWITGYGSLKKVISPDYANLITDNVYRYAKNGEYGRCAIAGYKQIVDKLTGGRISGPLKTVGNLCMALILAEVVCFLYAFLGSVARRTADSDILEHAVTRIRMTNPNVRKTRTEKIYDPPSSSSGGGGGSRGGGGGGGFHGGGGGHGF